MALTKLFVLLYNLKLHQDIPYRITNLTAPCRICINHSTSKKIRVLTGMSRHCTVTYLGHCIVPVKCQI